MDNGGEEKDIIKELLLKRAEGYKVEDTEVVMSKDGRPTRIKKVTRHIPPDVKAITEYRRLYGQEEKEEEAGEDRKALLDSMCDVLTNSEGLNDRERLFCLFYSKTFNATASALKAGYVKDNPAIAAQMGYKLLARKHVRDTIEKLKRMRFAHLMVSEEDVIEQLAKIAFADITDYVEYDDGCVRVRDAAMVDGSVIDEIRESGTGVRVKLADKQRALQTLAALLADRKKKEEQAERLDD